MFCNLRSSGLTSVGPSDLLAAKGKVDAAIELAESSRRPWTNDTNGTLLCEGILLSLGRAQEAYRDAFVRARAEAQRSGAPELQMDLFYRRLGESGGAGRLRRSV
jgi:hypothetical protein